MQAAEVAWALNERPTLMSPAASLAKMGCSVVESVSTAGYQVTSLRDVPAVRRRLGRTALSSRAGRVNVAYFVTRHLNSALLAEMRGQIQVAFAERARTPPKPQWDPTQLCCDRLLKRRRLPTPQHPTAPRGDGLAGAEPGHDPAHSGPHARTHPTGASQKNSEEVQDPIEETKDPAISGRFEASPATRPGADIEMAHPAEDSCPRDAIRVPPPCPLGCQVRRDSVKAQVATLGGVWSIAAGASVGRGGEEWKPAPRAARRTPHAARRSDYYNWNQVNNRYQSLDDGDVTGCGAAAGVSGFKPGSRTRKANPLFSSGQTRAGTLAEPDSGRGKVPSELELLKAIPSLSTGQTGAGTSGELDGQRGMAGAKQTLFSRSRLRAGETLPEDLRWNGEAGIARRANEGIFCRTMPMGGGNAARGALVEE